MTIASHSQALQDEDGTKRFEAVKGLGESAKIRKYLTHIARMLADPSADVRRIAKWALVERMKVGDGTWTA